MRRMIAIAFTKFSKTFRANIIRIGHFVKSWKNSLLNKSDNCGPLDPPVHKFKCVDKEDHFFGQTFLAHAGRQKRD